MNPEPGVGAIASCRFGVQIQHLEIKRQLLTEDPGDMCRTPKTVTFAGEGDIGDGQITGSAYAVN